MKIAPQHRTMKDFYLYLDAGHGGLDEYGHYTTAPAKMYDHGEGYEFHDGGKFYEGVFNRQVAERVKAKFKFVHQERYCIPTYHPIKDTPLHNRTNYANKLYKEIGMDGFMVSIHANAGNGTGFEIFTSPGNTKSDMIAEFIYNEVSRKFPGYKLRPDIRDGDPDKEAPFWMLTKSAMPAVLIECGFFDNPKDAEMMMSSVFQDKIAGIIFQAYQVFKNEI